MIFLVLGNKKFSRGRMRLLFRFDRAMAANRTALEAMQQALPPGPSLFFRHVLKLQPFRSEYLLPNFRIAHSHT